MAINGILSRRRVLHFRHLNKASKSHSTLEWEANVLALESHTSKHLDLEYILTFPITDVTLSPVHNDGIPNKTEKYILIKISWRKSGRYYNLWKSSNANILDGGCSFPRLLFVTQSQHMGQWRDLLSSRIFCRRTIRRKDSSLWKKKSNRTKLP